MKILNITSVDPGWSACWNLPEGGSRTSRIIALALVEEGGQTKVIPLDTGVVNIEEPEIRPVVDGRVGKLIRFAHYHDTTGR